MLIAGDLPRASELGFILRKQDHMVIPAKAGAVENEVAKILRWATVADLYSRESRNELLSFRGASSVKSYCHGYTHVGK